MTHQPKNDKSYGRNNTSPRTITEFAASLGTVIGARLATSENDQTQKSSQQESTTSK